MEALMEVPTTGGIVLIDERKPDLSYRLLQERAHGGRGVLCITREPPARVARRHPMDGASHYWLITGDGERSVDPFRLDAMTTLVEGFLASHPGGTILIDGVELLMVMNSYAAVRDFLAGLHDQLQKHRADCVVPIDTRTLTVPELKELRAVFPMMRGDGLA